MPENSKLQPAKLGKNFDPVDHSNRNFFFSLILSVLLHWLIYFLFEHRGDFFPSKPKLVKVDPKNLLILKRGHSQDPSKNTQGAPKPTLAGPQKPPTPPTPPIPPTPPKPIEKPKPKPEPKPKPKPEPKKPNHKHKALKKVEKVEEKKVVEEKKEEKKIVEQKVEQKKVEEKKPVKKEFDPNQLSFLPKEVAPPRQENNKGLDNQTRRDIDELYGEEFGDLGTAEKDFIRNNLRDIGRITQKYLEYPQVAAYLGQDGTNAVEFYLHPNGDITDLKIIIGSEYKMLDDNTLKTIQIAYKDYPRPKTKTLIRIRVRYYLGGN
ncbi:energy transducer TonB [Helicobacter pylori]|uniref:energy transducer TonB n=1 Tax=Helicobacter pylori TaxID=210 RepID=UPI001923B8E6|nr:energy transducer TonB [Helicobacter pylori]QQW63076.1 energy transducer TonB [Helicobacter pylori]QQW66151.1 energy transducer TonB [Helicobacter pylori]QQW67422.1 energy transducer TonB [Helicobacter pylori]QQW95125.1 energy transducer TonB [Helicobacter pylori]QQW98009.1 energy transducer TonB [Helicobacter pylori]